MRPAQQSLVFTETPFTLAAGVVFVLMIAVLGWLAWRRGGYRASTGWLEALRLLLAVCIAVTLNRPEWRELFKPEHKPTLAVLVDVSKSMETRDVLDPADPGREPTTREEAAKPLLDGTTWKVLAERMEVVMEPFSSQEQPSREGTDINAALLKAEQDQPHLAAVVLASDGDWNTGEAPAQAAVRLRMRQVPVFTELAGSETRMPAVELASFDVPTFATTGKPLRIPFAIESSLPHEAAATLQMQSSNGQSITKDVVIPAMGRLEDVITWKPENAGETKLTLTVPKVAGERLAANHALEAPLSVRREQLHVLVIDTYPRWEYRYLRNALQRDPGVEVNTLLLNPDTGLAGAGKGYLPAFPKDEALAKYDVVFIGDIGTGHGQLTAEECEALRKLARDQAGGIVFLPGLRGYEGTLQGTALADLMPVVWDNTQPRGFGTSAPGNLVLTEEGTHSLLTRLEDTDEGSARVWQNLPGFQWYAPVERAKAGTETLATHASEANQYGRVPLIVTKTYGSGKVLFMGTDGAWRWRKGVEDLYHYRFWGQVVRWMAYQRNMSQGENMRLFYSPDRPRTGAALTLNANVQSLSGGPLRDGAVIAQITAPSGRTTSVRLAPAGEDAWGLFTGVFTPAEPGEHHVRLTSADAGAALDTVISVQGVSRERLGQPARPEVLREIAQITRGAMMKGHDPAEILAAVAALPRPEPEERRLQLWAHPLWAGSLIFLLCIFWVGRKAAGTF